MGDVPWRTFRDWNLREFILTCNLFFLWSPCAAYPTKADESQLIINLLGCHFRPFSLASVVAYTNLRQQQPKLRKRRSSLTLATSPMNTIRSPTRAANNALHLQRQLFTAIGPNLRLRAYSVGVIDCMMFRNFSFVFCRCFIVMVRAFFTAGICEFA